MFSSIWFGNFTLDILDATGYSPKTLLRHNKYEILTYVKTTSEMFLIEAFFKKY